MRFIAVATVISLLPAIGCSDSANQTGVSRRRDDWTESGVATTQPTLDFDALHQRLKTLKASEMSFFNAAWPPLQAELQAYLETGQIQQLPVEQQEALYMELDYLRACYHPEVLHNHGDEILKITQRLQLTDETQRLVESMEQPR